MYKLLIVLAALTITVPAYAESGSGHNAFGQDNGGTSAPAGTTRLEQETARANHQYEEWQEEGDLYHYRSYVNAWQNIKKINNGVNLPVLLNEKGQVNPLQSFSSQSPPPSIY